MILKRLGQGLLVLLVLETVTFFLIRLLPGHPFMGEKKLPEHVLQQLQTSYGLDQSSLVQYGRYWWNMLVHGDLGPSLVKEGISVADMIGQSFPVSLQLGVIGMVISILVGIPAGIVAALYKNRWMDWWVMLVSMAGICIPAFVVAPLLGVALGMHVPGLSVAGWDSPGCVVLPALTLGLVNAAYLARLTRGGMLEVLGQDFIRTARAKGAGPFRTVWKHALRGGLIPALSYLGPALCRHDYRLLCSGDLLPGSRHGPAFRERHHGPGLFPDPGACPVLRHPDRRGQPGRGPGADGRQPQIEGGVMKNREWNSMEEQGSSLWRDAFLRLSRNRAAMFSLLALALIVAACFLGPLLPWLPHPNVQDLSRIAESPSWQYWFGTDQLGRDLLARVLYGGRISLLVGVVATGVSLVIGVTYGLVSGYAGGRLDALMMRLVDVLFALPFIVLVIIFSLSVEEPAQQLTQWVSGVTGWSVEMVSPMTGLIPLFIAIGALGWLTLARIVRTQTLELKGQEFVEAARSLGIGHMKILFRHIAPNLFGSVIVYTTLAVPGIMLLEAVLSFLGLGVKAPNSSWGTLIKEGADRMEVSPELLLFPALLFSATLLALNFLGDGLRDALDPKSSKD